MTFKQPESRDTKHVYTIYVEWTAPVGNEEVTFPDTNAWVSLTDGIITEEIHMEAKVSEHDQIDVSNIIQNILLCLLISLAKKNFEGIRRGETLACRMSSSRRRN